MNNEKDILIYLYENNLAPCGGPNGVGYYIYEENKKNNSSRIEFISGDVPKASNKNVIRWFFRFINMFIWPKADERISDKYRIVHFHSTIEMYLARKSLRDYKGKVVLMSHTPVPTAFERFEAIKQKLPSWVCVPKLLLRLLQKADKYAFNRADYIVFPCEYAMEPYYSWWPGFKDIIDSKKEKVKYITTGITPRTVQKTRKDIRSELDIPENATICCFVGRHNEVKGYDNLKKIGERLLNDNSNMYFLICGNEFPLKGLQHDRWIEVGFTKDPYSYIAASDLFVLPNKETYFDLVAIEVLSLGKIMVASKTGGNKYYEHMNLKGVKLYEDIEGAIKLIQEVAILSDEVKKQLELENRVFYNKYLNAESMYEQTVQLYESILSD